jgi:hypothetical protein
MRQRPFGGTETIAPRHGCEEYHEPDDEDHHLLQSGSLGALGLLNDEG